LKRFNLPTYCSGIDAADVIVAMELDKKIRGKAIQWVLLEDIGRVVIRSDVPEKEVLSVLQEVIKP
jgi:3-dehydroquinate synthase